MAEGKIKEQIEVTRRRGRRRKKLLDDLKDRTGYYELKEEALDRTMWRNRFGRGFGPVVWQVTDDDGKHSYFVTNGYVVTSLTGAPWGDAHKLRYLQKCKYRNFWLHFSARTHQCWRRQITSVKKRTVYSGKILFESSLRAYLQYSPSCCWLSLAVSYL